MDSSDAAMDLSNEMRQTARHLFEDRPTVWLFPSGGWVLGILLGGQPCYFVGCVTHPYIGAFSSFWDAMAALASVIKTSRANDILPQQLSEFTLVDETAEPMDDLPEGWQVYRVVNRRDIAGWIAMSPSGPWPRLYGDPKLAKQAALQLARGNPADDVGIRR